MRDGQTQKFKKATVPGGIDQFLARYSAKIVQVSGASAGREFPLDGKRLTIGRGPGVDVALEDATMSRQHAAIEYSGEGFRIRDLGSTNGILLDGKQVQVGDLDHGDRFQIGTLRFQIVIEEREETPDTYELSSET